jgi:phage gp36-like protein
MGRYIAQSDIEDKFGVSTVAKWSNLAETSEDADTARITKAIAYGEEVVENMFRGRRYAVPFSGTSVELVDWCATFAGVWLYSSRGSSAPGNDADAERYNGMVIRAEQDIQSAIGGARKLPLALARATPTVPIVVHETGAGYNGVTR